MQSTNFGIGKLKGGKHHSLGVRLGGDYQRKSKGAQEAILTGRLIMGASREIYLVDRGSKGEGESSITYQSEENSLPRLDFSDVSEGPTGS